MLSQSLRQSFDKFRVQTSWDSQQAYPISLLVSKEVNAKDGHWIRNRLASEYH